MAEESISTEFLSAVSELRVSATTAESTNSKQHIPLTNGNCTESRATNRKPIPWRNVKSHEEKPSTSWRGKGQPRNAPSAFSTWRGRAGREDSKSAFQLHDAFVKRKSKIHEASKPFGGFRKNFGSNSSIASDCSPSSVYPEGRKPFTDSRKKFGSGWSLTSESSTVVHDRGLGRGVLNRRYKAVGISNPRTYGQVKPTCHRPASSSDLNLKYLETLSQKEVHQIALEVTISKSPFSAYLEKSPLESDWLMLILSVVAKVCVSDYEGNRSDLLHKLCKSPFLDTLSNYLGDMSTEPNPETLDKFLRLMPDLCEFYSSVLDAWPIVAVKKNLKKLITKTKEAVNNMPLYLGVPVDENIISKLESYIDTFDDYKKMHEKKQLVEKRMRSGVEKIANSAPPNDFRHLGLYPTREDLFSTQRGFIRPNKIEGAYESVEHYLDVQFRLLREDFIDSVRSGVQKYSASKSDSRRRFKFDNVRIYPDTRLVSWERRNSVDGEVGIRLNFDPRGKFAETCDWVHNKRFMFGSLLLLTADDFNSFLCATVLERDIKTLKKGCVLAALVEETPDFHKIFAAKPFTMAESEVFFQPYFLILQALKKLDDASFPMSKYIVRGLTEAKCPSYPPAKDMACGLYFNSFPCTFLRRNRFQYGDSDYFWGVVLSADDDLYFEPYTPAESDPVELDIYQKEAFEAGMQRDFCVIQGPPGTGKTFLGLQLVQSILNECKIHGKKLPILVVCLTNHALDQFLERILAFTNKIVRVGGQSQNENLTSRNLRTRRRALFHVLREENGDFECMSSKINQEIAYLSTIIENTQKMKKYVETPVGILSTTLLKQVVDPNLLSVVENDRTLWQWLLEDTEYEAPLMNDVVNLGHLYENGTTNGEDFEPVASKKGKNNSVKPDFICEVKCIKSYSVTLDELKQKLESITEEYNALIQNEDSLLEKGCDSSLIHFEKAYLKNQIKYRTRQFYKLKANLEAYVQEPETKILNALRTDPTKLPSKLRWLIYWSWLSGLQKKLLAEISELETKRRAKMNQHEEYKMFEDLYIMEQSDVVGMTTTGAARLNKLLGLLKPAIVIVEEAAEVLEAHVVAALTKSCRHLILIGDHQQLRPSSAVYELSKNYNIDVSLFERMVKNGMHCPMLKVQHRMRPEISANITPLIYPELKNHESVLSLEPVRGVLKNMFFMEHNMPETVSDDETSKENTHEAEFVVKLARYFIQQGYKPENITLLTFYAGQMFRIRNLLKNNCLNDVTCVVVDKYQGEENDIIILSLVRSNEDGNIGFLSIENRVCVALSRAKTGFFMIGNMDCLAKTRLWQKLRNIFKEKDAIGKEFPLYCDRHDKITRVSKAQNFRLVHNGGCGAVCNMLMACGHNCLKKCHLVLGKHRSLDCAEPCKRLCLRNHECKKLCKEKCGDCEILVEKLLPNCQHKALVPCHVSEYQYLCTELVEDVVLISCDHVVKRKCHQKLEDVECTKPCRKWLNCGHMCTRLCHEEDDPDHIKFQCQKQCGRYYKGCKKGHRCLKFCYEPCGRCPFKEEINLSCGHVLTLPCSTNLDSVKCPYPCLKICSQCKFECEKPCWESKLPCVNKVRKVIPTCGHEIEIDCCDEPTQNLCKQKCQLMTPCGHKCQLMCGQTCDSRECKEWVTSTARKPLCGHEYIYVLCNQKEEVLKNTPESFLANCQEPCDAMLECGDVCSGTCGQCFQGRLHQTCPKLCGRTFICGHRCKFPCQKLCPPCSEPCSFRCAHSQCNEKCGIPCSTCKQPCEWKCKHTKCTRKCGDICNRQPCDKPCDVKLPCGHDCIGFCGEPCPPQCRLCSPEIANVIFGYEKAPDARFVLMVDCNHTVESKALDEYFSASLRNGEIMLKGCPLCGKQITKTLRYMNFFKRIYQQIAEMKTKTFEDLRSFDLNLEQLVCEIKTPLFSEFARICLKNIPDRSKKHIFSPEILSNFIYFFEACQVLISHEREFAKVPGKNEIHQHRVAIYFDNLIRRLLTNFNANRQLMLDFNLELRRYHLMADYQCIYTNSLKRVDGKDKEISEICAEIKQILFGFTKFTDDEEGKIRSLFEKLRTRLMIFSASSWPQKKLTMKKELPRIFDDLKAGFWFQCLNGHYYCIDAMENEKENTADCPECVKKGILVTKESGRRRKRRGRR